MTKYRMIKLEKVDVLQMMVIGLITAVAYGLFAFSLPITDTVESNYALTAKEMFLAKDWLSPRIFGSFWFDKPPFEYWAIMISYSVFGISDIAARIPSFIAAGLGTATIYGATQILFGDRLVSRWASVILGTSLGYWYISHAVLTDGWLFLFSLGIYLFAYLAFVEESKRFMRYAYIAAGLAVLTKGPVGILLPGIVLFSYVLSVRRATLWKILFDPLGLLLFAVVILPWYGGMYQVHGMEFITGFLGLHNVVRATEAEHPRFNYWFYYLVVWPISLLPWTGYTVMAMVQQGKRFYALFKQKGLAKVLEEDQWEESHVMVSRPSWFYFSLLWTVVVVGFYSVVATKYLTYIFIAYIPAVILGAQRIVENTKKVGDKAPRKRFFAIAWAIVLIIIPLFLTSLLLQQSGKSFVSYTQNTKEEKIHFYRFYPVSYTFYSGKVATLILSKSQLEDKWVQGKTVMPYEGIDKFLGEAGDIFFVPIKYEKEVAENYRGVSLEVIGKEYDWIIYKAK